MNLRAWLFCLLVTAIWPAAFAATRIDYGLPPSQSKVSVPVLPPVLNPLCPTDCYLPYKFPRSYAFADFNGDSLVDIIVAPTF